MGLYPSKAKVGRALAQDVEEPVTTEELAATEEVGVATTDEVVRPEGMQTGKATGYSS